MIGMKVSFQLYFKDRRDDICLDNYCLAYYNWNMEGKKSATTGPRNRFDSLEQEVYLNLWRTYDRLRMLEDELFCPYDLTNQQYNLLRLLKATHPSTIQTLSLANRLVSRAPDITRMLDKLEQRGLVVRERLPENRRVVQVGISDKGIKLLEEIALPLAECHAKQLGHLDGEQLQELVRLLRLARQPHESPDSKWNSD